MDNDSVKQLGRWQSIVTLAETLDWRDLETELRREEDQIKERMLGVNDLHQLGYLQGQVDQIRVMLGLRETLPTLIEAYQNEGNA